MIKIIGKTNTGKTAKLMRLAKENRGYFVCAEPERMIEKAHSYGIFGLQTISYNEYINSILNSSQLDWTDKYYIDNLTSFLTQFDIRIEGFNLSAD